MKLFSTDVLALACIGGCAAVGVGATAALFGGPHSESADCVIESGTFVSSISISADGNISMGNVPLGAPNLQWSEQASCVSVEDHHRKRRRRPHVDHERVRVRIQMGEARVRMEEARVRAMERRLEVETQAIEEAARALESVMEDDIEARIEEQMRRLEERLEGIGEEGRG